MLFENNAEIRATGGLPGPYAVIGPPKGRISLTRQGAGGPTSRSSPHPSSSQSSAERQIYDDQIARYFVDTNFTPEFSRTAVLAREMWRQHTGQRIDGVVSVDAVSMSYLLRATGPVKVPDGIELDPVERDARTAEP